VSLEQTEQMTMVPVNHHATSLVLGRFGVLIEGPAGSGKTSLALELLRQSSIEARFAALIADDQTWLEARHGRLIACCPPVIAGQAEVRGYGIIGVKHCEKAVIDLVVRLVAADAIQRMPEAQKVSFHGITLPMILAPQRDVQRGSSLIRAVFAQGALG
jgi:HPr kinase/phosphorylase